MTPDLSLLPTPQDYVMMIRVLAAFLLGGLVGLERQRMRRPAGLRTHMLVAAGSACFTVASIYGFDGLGTNRDPARLAAQIVTGIGFLGAGVIFRGGSGVSGLTTAASIWMTAALGVLCGLGLYWVAGFATVLTWFALRILKVAESLGFRQPTTKRGPAGDDDILPDEVPPGKEGG